MRRLLADFAISDAICDIDQLQLQMAAVIRRMLDKAMEPTLLESGTRESPTDPLTISYFMRFVCGHDTWADAKRAKSRAELEQDFVLQPEYSSSLTIMVAHGGAREALKNWRKEDKERSRQIQVLEKQTEEELALKRPGEVDQHQAAPQEVERKPPGKKTAKKALSKKQSTRKKVPRKETASKRKASRKTE